MREPQEPLVLALRGDGKNPELIVGMGDHDCIVYRPTEAQLRRLALDAVKIVLSRKD